MNYLCGSLGMFLVNFSHVFICYILIVSGLFYAFRVVLHVFIGLKRQRKNNRRKIWAKMHE